MELRRRSAIFCQWPAQLPDAYTFHEDYQCFVANVLSNDDPTDGPTLEASLASGPMYGTLVLHANGYFDYTPNLNYNGPDSFSYNYTDGRMARLVAV